MVEDIKHYGIFRVDLVKSVLNVVHAEIANHCMKIIDDSDAYTTYFSPALNKKFMEDFPNRDRFENALSRAGDEFVAKTQRIHFARGGGHKLNYWCSVYREGDFHDSHIHRRSLISGTYYPQTGDDSAAITFEAPYTGLTMHDSLDNSALGFEFKPRSGDCLMWPSWLPHRVTRQEKSNVPRVAISFNIDYKYEPI
ncbi:TIGR02466 family protein [Hyphococcus flavus]|uniref:TIGR02466 family protein n=1 Tax=Hyphococcus flavus TaxID=1866326 RepID=A0AAE9ZDC8_9PROT|nr:TIGR02466 family protein [Hyphococcus flavus]WDI30422.1 TIGR02466 family protein [Hyphococcus flavus]